MNRIPDIKARLERWGCWAANGRATTRSAGVSSAYRLGGVARSGGDSSLWNGIVPYDEIEAGRTEAAVVRLDDADKALAVVVYVKAPTGTLTTWGIRAGMHRGSVFSALCRIDAKVQAYLANPLPGAHHAP